MKKYKEYMNTVTAPDTLRQRLVELEAPASRPIPWKRYGSLAAGQFAADWDIPSGAARRELTGDEIIALMGGEDAVNTHLDWGMHILTGWGAWYEDGSFWGAYINGLIPNYGGPASQFEFAVTADQLPPTCIVFPGSETQEIRGLAVTADGADWEEDAFSFPVFVHQRRVSFMKGDYGYRFEMSCGSGKTAEEMVSRLVCHIADRGLALTYTCSNCGCTFPFGSVHNDPAIGAEVCGICGQTIPTGTEHHCAGGTYTCPDCGVTVPAGDKHYHTQDETHTCDICGQTIPTGEAHDHEVCHLPLAPEPTPSTSGSHHDSGHHGDDHH